MHHEILPVHNTIVSTTNLRTGDTMEVNQDFNAMIARLLSRTMSEQRGATRQARECSITH
jgi:hypothetical protein